MENMNPQWIQHLIFDIYAKVQNCMSFVTKVIGQAYSVPVGLVKFITNILFFSIFEPWQCLYRHNTCTVCIVLLYGDYECALLVLVRICAG